MNAPGPHLAEPFRQGYEPDVRYGWQCLTCMIDRYTPTREDAEKAAADHLRRTSNSV